MREVLSYSRRGSRFTPSQAEAWEAYAAAWVIPDEAVDEPGSPGRLVRARGPARGRDRSGGRGGDRGAGRAPARPRRAGPRGVAARGGRGPGRGGRGRGATNVRFCSVDAAWMLEHVVAPGLARGALDVLPRPVAEDPAPQAPPGRRRLRRARRVPAAAGGRVAARHRLGRLRRADARGARRRAACSRAGRWSGGRSGRSPSSSARGWRSAARSPTSPTAGSEPVRRSIVRGSRRVVGAVGRS